MFNPSSFGRSLPNSGMYSRMTDNLLVQPQKSIAVIPVDNKRTRWDQPLTLVAVLYSKFGLPLPEQLRKEEKAQDYIKRCYEKCTSEADNKRMEGLLRKIIQQAESKLHAINWAEFEVPSLPKIAAPQPTPKPMVIEPILSTKVQTRQFKQPVLQVRSVSKDQMKPIERKQPQNKQIQARDLPQTVKARSSKLEEKSEKVLNKLKAKQIATGPETTESVLKKFERYQRFKGQVKLDKKQKVQEDDLQSVREDWKIVGTSQSLEKQYLRITGMPDPKTVRPEEVLKRVLVYLRNKYNQGEDYEYIIWQFRSLRQDLLIQHIKNSFAVECYQENSRISLQCGDMGQYNQCQSALWDFYRSGVYFTKKSMNKYIGFQLLSLILQLKDQQFEHMLVRLDSQILESDNVQEVLKRVLKLGNYSEFFKFYRLQDITTRSLIDQYIDKIRAMCLAMVCKTFGQKVKLELLAAMLGDDRRELEQLIREVGGTIENDQFMLKLSNQAVQSCQLLMERKKNVYLE